VKREKSLSIALTIAGSDSGGGAGLQADLKTFTALHTHGVSAVTCITAQNPRRVIQVQPCAPSMVQKQLTAVFEELRPAAAKAGMLYSESIIRTVAGFLENHRVPFIVDPVMISTSGAPLLAPGAIRALCQVLMPLATLLTPNLHEAEAILETRLGSVEDLRGAAKALYRCFGVASLVKGGHLRGLREAVDIFYDGHDELLLSAPYVRGVATHGTGCTYSAAITAWMARGLSLADSVIRAKEFVTQAIAQNQKAGKHRILNSCWQQPRW
jgi:hydroxymethylpyrimidine/phosphomethylpyrimidine kinase